MSEFINEERDIVFCDLLFKLKQMGFPIEGTLISYWLVEEEVYVYCGVDPLPDEIKIPKDDFYGK